MRLSDAERRIMEVVWNDDGICAREIAAVLGEPVGWKKTTTYTMISVCIKKGFLRREDPHFHCFAAASRAQVAQGETDALLDSNYDGRPDLLVAALVSTKKLSLSQLARISQAVRELEEQP